MGVVASVPPDRHVMPPTDWDPTLVLAVPSSPDVTLTPIFDALVAEWEAARAAGRRPPWHPPSSSPPSAAHPFVERNHPDREHRDR